MMDKLTPSKDSQFPLYSIGKRHDGYVFLNVDVDGVTAVSLGMSDTAHIKHRYLVSVDVINPPISKEDVPTG